MSNTIVGENDIQSFREKEIEDSFLIPDYIQRLPASVLDAIKSIMIDIVEKKSSSEAIFQIKDIRKGFIDKISEMTTTHEELKYVMSNDFIDGFKKKKERISPARLAKARREADIIKKNKVMLQDYLESPSKVDIQNYIIEAYCGLIPVGEHNKNNLHNSFYTTQEILEYEKIIIENATEKDDFFNLKNIDVIEAAISKKKPLISNEQIAASYECTSVDRRLSVVEGVAGAGKSFTMEVVNEAFIKSDFKVMGTALSWNAAGVLKSSAKIPDCRAIEGLVMGMEKAHNEGKEFFSGNTLLIVDEAGLVGLKNMAKIIKYTGLSSHKVKIVLTGDTKQLDSVSAGSGLSLVKALIGSKVIKVIRRQHLTSHKNMVYALMELRSGHGLNYLNQQNAIHFCKDNESTLNRMVVDFVNFKYNNPNKTSLILARTNNDVNALNQKVRKMYKKMGWIYGQETDDILVSDGTGKSWNARFAVGDIVSLCVNDRTVPVYDIPEGEERKEIHEKTLNVTEWNRRPASESGVFNRNTGTVIGVSKMKDGSYTLIIEMNGDVSGRILINTNKYGLNLNSKYKTFPVIHNFATTIYGSQGQTVDEVFMKDGGLDFRLAYVGASRHRKGFTVYANEQELIEKIDKFYGKSMPKEIADALMDKGIFDEDNKTHNAPRLKRYRYSAYLSVMAKEWGKESEKETVTGYERKLKMKKNAKTANDKKEQEKNKERLIVRDDPQESRAKVFRNDKGEEEWSYEDDVIKKTPMDDTCIYDYKVSNPRGETLIEVAGKISGIDNSLGILFGIDIADRVKKEKLFKTIDTICAVNGYDKNDVNKKLEFGTEIYMDDYYSQSVPDKIDFEKLELLSHSEFKNIEDSERVDTYQISQADEKDKDNRSLLDEKKIEELVELDKEKQAKIRDLVNPMYREDYDFFLNNERIIQNRGSKSEFNYEDYTKTDRYSSDMSKSGGNLNRGEIEEYLKNNWVLPSNFDIPLLPKEEFVGYVNHKGEIIFKDYANSEKTMEEQKEFEAFNAFVGKMRDTYWGLTKYKQPRVFAMDPYTSVIKSKYDLNGKCTVGDGYPPLFLSPMPKESKHTIIVPGFENAMKAHKYFSTRFKDRVSTMLQDNIDENSESWSTKVDELKDRSYKNGTINEFLSASSECPNIIWGAKGVDWGLHFQELGNRKELAEEVAKMVILVGKSPSEKDIEWAINLQKKIYLEYKQKVQIKGTMPAGFKDIYVSENNNENDLQRKKSNLKP